ncbi:MAG TPA: hypothetical protein VNX25_00865 [Verrucomicrobiae bacterium]|nr:hypothetical protein [Verrucomicrobiae bacterium]
MEWKAGQPEEAGYYWFRDPFGNEPEIVKVGEDGVAVFGEHGVADITDYADGEWYGPLLPPL